MRVMLLILVPVAVTLLVLTRLITLEALKRKRAYGLVSAFVISASVNPPPDALSMSMMAISLYLLCEAALLFAQRYFKL